MTWDGKQVVAVDGISVRVPSTGHSSPLGLESFTRDMPRCVPMGRWDRERDSFTPATKMSTRFAGFMTGTCQILL